MSRVRTRWSRLGVQGHQRGNVRWSVSATGGGKVALGGSNRPVRHRQAAARGRHTLLPIEQSSNRETTGVGGRGTHQVRIALATHDIPNYHASFLHGESCHAAGTLNVAVLVFFGLSSDTRGVWSGHGMWARGGCKPLMGEWYSAKASSAAWTSSWIRVVIAAATRDGSSRN